MSDYVLPWHCLNSVQHESIKLLLDAAKRAHTIDVVILKDGKEFIFQADWLKSLVPGSAREIYSNTTMAIPMQCSRHNGHGPEGAYCKQHAKRFETF